MEQSKQIIENEHTPKDILNYLESKENIKIFFTGIGGISMSAIAAALKQKNYKVGGSDIVDKWEIQKLSDMGIEIFIEHKKENVDGYDMLVYNARIKSDNPEIIRAQELNIPIIKRAQMLGALMHSYKTSVGIAGTHGKSSVTSMTSEIFMQAYKISGADFLDPTFFIGAIYPPINSAYRVGAGDYFILEADEFCDSFLNFYPNIALISNIEMDHPDYFADLQAVISSFEKYLANASDTAIINGDDENVIKAAENFNDKIITFGIQNQNANIIAQNIDYSNVFPEFDIFADGVKYAHIKLCVPGEFNIYNALAAASAAYACGIDGRAVETGLNIFKGASRRFEYRGDMKNTAVKIYEDYAHHPTEIKKTLMSVAPFLASTDNGVNGVKRNLWCVFQPHTYSRTHELLEDLCEALTYADRLILTEIYSATEQNKYNIYSKDIADKINSINKEKMDCIFIKEFEEIAEYLMKNASDDDVVLIMGAGDINNLTRLLI